MLCSRSKSYNCEDVYLPFLFAYLCLYQLIPCECCRKYSEGAESLKDDRGLVQISPGCLFTYGKIKNANIKIGSLVPSLAQHSSLRMFLCTTVSHPLSGVCISSGSSYKVLISTSQPRCKPVAPCPSPRNSSTLQDLTELIPELLLLSQSAAPMQSFLHLYLLLSSDPEPCDTQPLCSLS